MNEKNFEKNLPIAQLNLLQREYGWHPEKSRALNLQILQHPDIPPQQVQEASPTQVTTILQNPALPFFILENPDFFQHFEQVDTLRAFIKNPQTPVWLLQALRQHRQPSISHAAGLHRYFLTLGTVGASWQQDCRRILCQSSIPLVADSAFAYPDTSRRRRFAAVPALPKWVMPTLGGNPDRPFSPERLYRMEIEAAQSEDSLLIFLAYALPSKRLRDPITMASSYRWEERLAATLRPDTPEEALIVLAEDTNALVHTTAQARMQGEDVFQTLWNSSL